jgi:hypothetical protein
VQECAHISCLPQSLLTSQALLKTCKAVVKECRDHRLFQVRIGPGGDATAVSAELEGHDTTCLKDFKVWCRQVVLGHEMVDAPESCHMEFMEALWPVLLDELKHFDRCTCSCLEPVRAVPPEDLKVGFLFHSNKFEVAPAQWRQRGHDRCVQRIPLDYCGFLCLRLGRLKALPWSPQQPSKQSGTCRELTYRRWRNEENSMIREINSLIINLKRLAHESGGHCCTRFDEKKWYSPGALPPGVQPHTLELDPSDNGKGHKPINALVLQAACEWAFVRPDTVLTFAKFTDSLEQA